MNITEILNPLLTNPAFQTSLVSVGVAAATVLFKVFAKALDASGKGLANAITLHLVSVIASFVATAATLASEGKLSSLDVHSTIAFLAMSLTTYLSSHGIRTVAQATKDQIKGKDDVNKQ